MAHYDDAYSRIQEHHYSHVAYQDPVCFSNYEPFMIDSNNDAYNASVFLKPVSTDHGDYGYNCNYDYDYDNDDSHGYDYDYDYYGNCHNRNSYSDPTINYFAHNYMEPNLIAYKAVACNTGYVSYHTQHSVSYSQMNSDFNEPEFEEYDPTPYGGGYDIVSVYGKPLPPSDQTCYPRSKPKPIGPSHTPESISQPVPKPSSKPEPKPTPTPMSIPTPMPLLEPEPKSKPDPKPMPMSIPTPIPPVGPESKHVHDLVPVPDPLESKEVREMGEYRYPGFGYDYPWPEYDHASANSVDYNYGYEKKVVQIPPYEYDPEVVDLCESIFGSWPCLARIRKQQMGLDNKPELSGVEIRHHNPLEDCADYIFGRPIAFYNG